MEEVRDPRNGRVRRRIPLVVALEFPLFVGGVEARGASVRDVVVPFDGTLFARVHEADLHSAQQAVAAAKLAFEVTRRLTRAERSAILRRAADLLEADREDFAATIASECGKPLVEARTEVQRGISTLRFSSEEANRLAGHEIPIDAAPSGAGKMAMTIRQPIGVVVAITPFNFPLNLSLHKIGPAIAAGNTVVHKPATTTPVTALKLAKLFIAAGLPPGGLNVIPGPGPLLGEFLATHNDVAMITFTGSPPVGMALRSQAGMKKVTLELGSNSAVIVDEDADLADAVSRCVSGAFAHSGQVCISVQRIFVHDSVADRFVAEMTMKAADLRIGHPLEESTQISSLISESELHRIEQWTSEATDAGAKLTAPVARAGKATLTPAVLVDVPEHTRIFAQEAFGPVVSINRFAKLSDAIERLNASRYGLQASMFTQNLNRAFEAAKRVDVGGFLINEVPQFRADLMPYGGVKESGTGREGPHYAIEEMTELKLICWNLKDPAS